MLEPCAYGEVECMVCNETCNEVSGNLAFAEMVVDPEEECDDGNVDTEVCAYGSHHVICAADCTTNRGQLASAVMDIGH